MMKVMGSYPDIARGHNGADTCQTVPIFSCKMDVCKTFSGHVNTLQLTERSFMEVVFDGSLKGSEFTSKNICPYCSNIHW